MPGPRNMVFQANTPAHRYTSHVVINHENSGNITYTNISNSNNISGRRVIYGPARSTGREARRRAPPERQHQILIAPTEESVTDEWVDDDDDGEDDSATSAQGVNGLPPPYTPVDSSTATDTEPQSQASSASNECPGFVTVITWEAGNVRREDTRLCTHETRECANKREMVRRQWFNRVGAQPPIVRQHSTYPWNKKLIHTFVQPAAAPVFDEVRFRNSFPEWMQRVSI